MEPHQRDVLLACGYGFADAARRDPMSSAVTSASWGSAKTACTINVHSAGDTHGYVAYGVQRVRALQPSLRESPYQKIKVQPYGSESASVKATQVGNRLASSLQLQDCASPRVSLSPSTVIPESPLPSSDFEDAITEEELHREASVSVERCRSQDGRMVFKKYFDNTMPTHRTLQDQEVYELNLYYKDLKGLSNVIQLQGHFYDPSNHLTFVFPDLGGNMYPTDGLGMASYMKQLLVALDALWKREIVHCNIKGGSKPNAIFDGRGKLTLIDFESAVRRHELIDQGHQGASNSWDFFRNFFHE